MIIGRIILGRYIALTLLGNYMNEHRVLNIFNGIESFDEISGIVAVDRTVIVKTEVFEYRRLLAVQKESEEILNGKDYLDDAASEPAELLKETFRGAFRRDVSRRYSELGQIPGQTADVPVDAHLVVV